MPGYWLDNYWLDNQWLDNYWLGEGVTPPTPNTTRRSGGPRYRKVPMLSMMGPHFRREPWTWQERPEYQKVER